MRTYYASDKKRREEAKRKKSEQKRLKRLGTNTQAKNPSDTQVEAAADVRSGQPEDSSS
jgi:hypothetical protein